MFIVGLTGGIATGKSAVCNIFQEHGIPVVDADTAARIVVEPGKVAWQKIRKEFGDEILCHDNYLDREKLGEIIFNDINKRQKLNAITHPEIHKEMCWQAFKYFLQGHPFIVMDLPLLFETRKLINYMHKIIVVTCDEDIQLERLMMRSGLSKDKAQSRISSQMPQEQKIEMANFLIENSGNLQDLRNQTLRIINILKCIKYHWRLRIFIGFSCLMLFTGIYYLKIVFSNILKIV